MSTDNNKSIQKKLFSYEMFSGKDGIRSYSQDGMSTIETIPENVLSTIKKYELKYEEHKQNAEYDELEVLVPLVYSNSRYSHTLFYALNGGTAFTENNGKIYIWYIPLKGLNGAGYYLLKNFTIVDNGYLLSVKYYLDRNEKLPNSI